MTIAQALPHELLPAFPKHAESKKAVFRKPNKNSPAKLLIYQCAW
jgi:hypothetical protein